MSVIPDVTESIKLPIEQGWVADGGSGAVFRNEFLGRGSVALKRLRNTDSNHIPRVRFGASDTYSRPFLTFFVVNSALNAKVAYGQFLITLTSSSFSAFADLAIIHTWFRLG